MTYVSKCLYIITYAVEEGANYEQRIKQYKRSCKSLLRRI
jgi:hypothetical protein